MYNDATKCAKIKGDKVFHTWVIGRELTKPYMQVKKTSIRATPKKPKVLRGRP